ncbi:MAG: spfh domain / band 7 family protein [Myxococcales bacterium]|nr:spfh domain / band 7 family protein [Myxococcales bacterium]
MRVLKAIGGRLKKVGYLFRATLWAAVLGIIELVQSERGRRVLGVLMLMGLTVGFVYMKPIRTINPGEVGVRVNRLTGHMGQIHEGWAWVVPGIHDLRRFPLRDQIYRPRTSARADGETPFQTAEGLSIGVDVAVRFALDPTRVITVAEELPADVGRELVEPIVDGVLHRTFAKHTVREIFSTKRAEIQKLIEDQLKPELLPDGVIVRNVFIGNVDLPADYKKGLEAMLAEELSSEKMRFTLELKDKQVKEAGLVGEADKVKREKAAEAAGQEEIIAARSRAEAMKHVLPFKEKEIEQRRLEAEASKVTRLKQAEAEAESRRIEAGGEADYRRKLADAEAHRIEVTGVASAAQMAREGALIQKNPLLIQKTLADKLSDKIQVIIAPPSAGGFFAGGLIGQRMDQARAEAQPKAAPKPVEAATEGD